MKIKTKSNSLEHEAVIVTGGFKTNKHFLKKFKNLKIVSVFGVGYDGVDVSACTEADVVLCTTVGAPDRPVAEATVGWMIALGHRMIIKDTLIRKGLWNERSKYMGGELRDRTLGIIGLGGIGSVVIELLRGFGMKQPLVFDPFMDDTKAKNLGVKKVTLQELMQLGLELKLQSFMQKEIRKI